MPFYCQAIYYARDDGVPLRARDDIWPNAVTVVAGTKRFDEQTDADRWCRAWVRTFNILDWHGQAGWDVRAPKRSLENAETEETEETDGTEAGLGLPCVSFITTNY